MRQVLCLSSLVHNSGMFFRREEGREGKNFIATKLYFVTEDRRESESQTHKKGLVLRDEFGDEVLVPSYWIDCYFVDIEEYKFMQVEIKRLERGEEALQRVINKQNEKIQRYEDESRSYQRILEDKESYKRKYEELKEEKVFFEGVDHLSKELEIIIKRSQEIAENSKTIIEKARFLRRNINLPIPARNAYREAEERFLKNITKNYKEEA